LITAELVALGAVAGFTIFLGLPVAVMTRVTARVKGFLNAITIGVLIFILIEVLPSAKQLAETAFIANTGTGSIFVFALIIGLATGIFGLVAYERYFIRIRQRRISNGSINNPLPQGVSGKQDISPQLTRKNSNERTLGIGEAQARGTAADYTLTNATSTTMGENSATKAVVTTSTVSSPPSFMSATEAKQIAFSIAVGIGVHNFSEGLAIGQSFASAALALSIFLAIGFAIHNTTEGFGIAAPMAGYKPSLTYLFTLGFIGGFPTLAGTIIGGIYPASPLALTFFLALAAGALIYIISGMFYVARRQTSNELFMFGLFIGFLVAYATDLFLAMLGA